MAGRPETQSVQVAENLHLTIKPLPGGTGTVSKVSFEQHTEGQPAQQVAIPAGYDLVCSNSQEPAGRIGEAWYMQRDEGDYTLLKDKVEIGDIFNPKVMSVWTYRKLLEPFGE